MDTQTDSKTDTQTDTHLLLHGFAVEHHPAKQGLDVIQLGIRRGLHHGLQHVLLQVQSVCLVLSKVGGHNVVGAQLYSATDGLLLTHDEAQQGALATAIGACRHTRVSKAGRYTAESKLHPANGNRSC